MTACLTSTSAASSLPAGCFLKRSKETGITQSHSANRTRDWLRNHSWDVTDHPPYSPDLAPSDFHLFGSLKKHLTSALQQTPTWSKLSPTGHRHLTPMSSTPGYKPWCHAGTDAEMPKVVTWRSGVYHLLYTCHVHIEVGIKFSASECLLFTLLITLHAEYFPSSPFGYEHTFLRPNVFVIAQKYKSSSKQRMLTISTTLLILMLISHSNRATCFNQWWSSSGHPVSQKLEILQLN
jgi:hypothetical protein